MLLGINGNPTTKQNFHSPLWLPCVVSAANYSNEVTNKFAEARLKVEIPVENDGMEITQNWKHNS